jgi:hypothetical protein
MEDFCRSYSITFSAIDSFGDPYYIVDNNNLKELLTHSNYDFFNYTFDNLLIDITKELITKGVAYLEILETRNPQNDLIGLDFQVLYSNCVKNRHNSYIVKESPNDNNQKRKVQKNNIVVFKISDIGISKLRVKRILKKIDKIESPNVQLVLNSEKNGFVWDKYMDAYNYNQLSVCKDLYWYFRNSNNPLFSECYLLYRNAKLKELRQNIYYYITNQINERLTALGNEYGFKGKIKEHWNKLDYSKCLESLKNGEYNTSQVGEIIFKY